jgi:hypothetical protein
LGDQRKPQRQTLIDPVLQERQNQLWQMGLGLPQSFNADQLASFDAARRAAGLGFDYTGQAGDVLGGLGQFQGLNVNAPNAQGFTAQAFGAGPAAQARAFSAGPAAQVNPYEFGGFDPGRANIGSVAAQTGPGGYEAYLNPYLNDVVSRSLGDVERARQEAANATRSQAAAAGAFGGSRSGVAEALTNREFANQAASTAANLRAQGFNTALGFNQADQDRSLQAGLGTLNAQTQGELASLQARLQGGLAGQSNRLAAALANQSAANQMGQFNAGQLQQGSQFNAGLRQQGNQFNAGQFQQGSQFNAGQQQQNSQFNAANQLQAQLANAQNALGAGNLRLNAGLGLGNLGSQVQQMGGFGANLLNQIGNQQFNLPYQNLAVLQGLLSSGQYGSTQLNSGSNQATQTGFGQQSGGGGGLFGTLLGGLGTFAGLGGIPGITKLFKGN